MKPLPLFSFFFLKKGQRLFSLPFSKLPPLESFFKKKSFLKKLDVEIILPESVTDLPVFLLIFFSEY